MTEAAGPGVVGQRGRNSSRREAPAVEGQRPGERRLPLRQRREPPVARRRAVRQAALAGPESRGGLAGRRVGLLAEAVRVLQPHQPGHGVRHRPVAAIDVPVAVVEAGGSGMRGVHALGGDERGSRRSRRARGSSGTRGSGGTSGSSGSRRPCVSRRTHRALRSRRARWPARSLWPRGADGDVERIAVDPASRGPRQGQPVSPGRHPVRQRDHDFRRAVAHDEHRNPFQRHVRLVVAELDAGCPHLAGRFVDFHPVDDQPVLRRRHARRQDQNGHQQCIPHAQPSHRNPR